MRQPTDEEREDARIEALEERERWTDKHALWCASRSCRIGRWPCDCRDTRTEDEDDA